MGSYFNLVLDTTPPNVDIYCPIYTQKNVEANITIIANKELSEYREIYCIDSAGNRYDYTFLHLGDTYICKFTPYGYSSGVATIYAILQDIVLNTTSLLSKSFVIQSEALSSLVYPFQVDSPDNDVHTLSFYTTNEVVYPLSFSGINKYEVAKVHYPVVSEIILHKPLTLRPHATMSVSLPSVQGCNLGKVLLTDLVGGTDLNVVKFNKYLLECVYTTATRYIATSLVDFGGLKQVYANLRDYVTTRYSYGLNTYISKYVSASLSRIYFRTTYAIQGNPKQVYSKLRDYVANGYAYNINVRIPNYVGASLSEIFFRESYTVQGNPKHVCAKLRAYVVKGYAYNNNVFVPKYVSTTISKIFFRESYTIQGNPKQVYAKLRDYVVKEYAYNNSILVPKYMSAPVSEIYFRESYNVQGNSKQVYAKLRDYVLVTKCITKNKPKLVSEGISQILRYINPIAIDAPTSLVVDLFKSTSILNTGVSMIKPQYVNYFDAPASLLIDLFRFIDVSHINNDVLKIMYSSYFEIPVHEISANGVKQIHTPMYKEIWAGGELVKYINTGASGLLFTTPYIKLVGNVIAQISQAKHNRLVSDAITQISQAKRKWVSSAVVGVSKQIITDAKIVPKDELLKIHYKDVHAIVGCFKPTAKSVHTIIETYLKERKGVRFGKRWRYKTGSAHDKIWLNAINDGFIYNNELTTECNISFKAMLDFILFYEQLMLVNYGYYSAVSVELAVTDINRVMDEWLVESNPGELPLEYLNLVRWYKWFANGAKGKYVGNKLVKGNVGLAEIRDSMVIYFNSRWGARILDYGVDGMYIYSKDHSYIDRLRGSKHNTNIKSHQHETLESLYGLSVFDLVYDVESEIKK